MVGQQILGKATKSPPSWWGNGRENGFYCYGPSIPQTRLFFKSAQNAQDQMTPDGLTLAALGFQYRSTA
ncbi:hypothetical protein [Vibrio cholerae]|uniref:hypothetical protein n=1 Tax=Vibrio cholerae TaxID=666 RepID=UPI0013B42F4C|nr:hypothetical protein [Vibrio cholerae]